MQGGDRLAQGGTPRGRRVVRVAGAQARDGTFQHRGRRFQIRIADTQQEHVFAAFPRKARLVVGSPGVRAIAADARHEGGKFHIIPGDG